MRNRNERTGLVNLVERYERCYVLEPTLPEQPPKAQIDQTCRTRREIEDVSQSCKDPLHVRPNCHKRDANILGHIHLTFLAHLVKRSLELKLRAAGRRVHVPQGSVKRTLRKQLPMDM